MLKTLVELNKSFLLAYLSLIVAKKYSIVDIVSYNGCMVIFWAMVRLTMHEYMHA